MWCLLRFPQSGRMSSHFCVVWCWRMAVSKCKASYWSRLFGMYTCLKRRNQHQERVCGVGIVGATRKQAVFEKNTIIWCSLSSIFDICAFLHFISKSKTWIAAKCQIRVHTYVIFGIVAHYPRETFLSPQENEFTSQMDFLQHFREQFSDNKVEENLYTEVSLICSGVSVTESAITDQLVCGTDKANPMNS